jgi:hypothetical protein
LRRVGEALQERMVDLGSMETTTGIGMGIGIAGFASGLMAMSSRSRRSSCRP